MEPMGLLAWVVIGAIAGWLAGQVLKSGGGVLTHVLVGIAGAFIAGFPFNALGFAGTSGFNIGSILVALTGAIGLLAVIHLINERNRQLNRELRKG